MRWDTEECRRLSSTVRAYQEFLVVDIYRVLVLGVRPLLLLWLEVMGGYRAVATTTTLVLQRSLQGHIGKALSRDPALSRL